MSKNFPTLPALLLATVLCAAPAAAQDGDGDLATAADCAKLGLGIGFDDEILTRAEKIAVLDDAIAKSVNTFEPCTAKVRAQDDGGTSGASGTSGTSGASNSSPAPNNAQAGAQSKPASGVQGDTGKKSDQAAQQNNAAQAGVQSKPATGVQGKPTAAQIAQQKATRNNQRALANGKLPEDIPLAENDDVIARQFRQLAMEETDSVLKAKYWNQYREYKGLPTKEVSQN